MDSLPPIPTPAPQRWREFRIQVLPVLIFLGIVAALITMWRTYVEPVNVVGEVEAVRATVTSLRDGLVAELTVDRFERVSRDQAIGLIVTTDPSVHEASLAAITADLNLMKERMDLDKTRNLDAYSRLKLDLLSEQVALSVAQARLPQAEAQYQRVLKLFQDALANVVAEADVDLARSLRDALQSEIQDRTKLIAQWEQELKQMEASGAFKLAPKDSVIEENIRIQQERLRLVDKPVVLKAPIDGVVSTILKRPGEKVVRGEAILTVSATTSDRVVGYIRQPLGVLPTTNDTVRVRTRAQRRQIGEGQILRVGAALEPISPGLVSADTTRIEMGLPILVGLPPGFQLVPGEFVDLFIRTSAK